MFQMVLRFSDMDAQGVVFNANYLSFFDEAIAGFVKDRLGAEAKSLMERGYAFHTVRALVEYKSSLSAPATIEIDVKLTKLGNSSLAFDLALYRLGCAEPAATGQVTWVHVDLERKCSLTIPNALRELLDGSVADQRASPDERTAPS